MLLCKLANLAPLPPQEAQRRAPCSGSAKNPVARLATGLQITEQILRLYHFPQAEVLRVLLERPENRAVTVNVVAFEKRVSHAALPFTTGTVPSTYSVCECTFRMSYLQSARFPLR